MAERRSDGISGLGRPSGSSLRGGCCSRVVSVDGVGGAASGADKNGNEDMGAYTVGSWVVLGQVLGRGRFGTVKLAKHELSGELSAVKILEKENVRCKDLSALVTHAASILQALDHENIVKCFGIETCAKRIYIFTELTEGGELFNELVRKNRMSEPAARFYFRQLLCGLAHCHDRGIFHRDLKPENLLLSSTHQLKICDFGLSGLREGGCVGVPFATSGEWRVLEKIMILRGVDVAAITSSQLLHTQCGTPNYVAPEIITEGGDSGKGYSGAEVDLWSCGVILYVLVAGALPFNEQEMDVLFGRILNAQFSCPDHFSQPLVSLVHSLLEVDPKRRLPLREIFDHPWMKMPDPQLAKVAGGSLDDVPSKPPGYVGRMPWDLETSMRLDEANNHPNGLKVGEVLHETFRLDSLDFGSARVEILESQGRAATNKKLRVQSDFDLDAATPAAAAVAAACLSATTEASYADTRIESHARDVLVDVHVPNFAIATAAAIPANVIGARPWVAIEGVSTIIEIFRSSDTLNANAGKGSVAVKSKGKEVRGDVDGFGEAHVGACYRTTGISTGVREWPVVNSPFATLQTVDVSFFKLLPSALGSAEHETPGAFDLAGERLSVTAAAFRACNASRSAGGSTGHPSFGISTLTDKGLCDGAKATGFPDNVLFSEPAIGIGERFDEICAISENNAEASRRGNESQCVGEFQEAGGGRINSSGFGSLAWISPYPSYSSPPLLLSTYQSAGSLSPLDCLPLATGNHMTNASKEISARVTASLGEDGMTFFPAALKLETLVADMQDHNIQQHL